MYFKCKMNTNPNTETTSNSMKFQPLPVSELLNLLPTNSDSSYESLNDSDSSVVETEDCLASKENETVAVAHTPRVTKTKDVSHAGYKSNGGDNKENLDHNWSSRTYPNKDSINQDNSLKKAIFFGCPSSEMKNRNVLAPYNSNSKTLFSDIKKTPDRPKGPDSSHKTKPSTPVIKSGIRKFTPGSVRKSHKKTPQKFVIDNSRESVRCLFPKTNEELKSTPAPLLTGVVTPLNKKPLPPIHAATPSYPQGIIGNQSKVSFKTTSIRGKNYMYIKKLGVGGSSEVYKVLEPNTSCEYAVKCVNLATDPEMAQGYINEIRLLRQLQDSDRVIRLFDYEYDRPNQYLRVVMEVGEMDLSSFLKARGASLQPAPILHYWEEMLQAVHYIHEHGVIHADLKPANFLFVCGRLKLIDFGIASAISSDATSVVRAHATGTYSYISPEALGGGQTNAPGAPNIKISFRSDVWSLGCILYSMVYGRTPFAHINSLAKLAAILDPNHRIDYPPADHLPSTLVAALKWCLTYAVRGRPSVRQLLAIPYLQSPSTGVPLPRPLLDKLQSLLTPDEFALLLKARVEH